ncbi:MAG: hypothetical protein V4514_03965 [Pseudomonadota bacterium]|uniref:hypothetical protein n=1 Tax=Phenylobacterium sp. TaxID=1871053 RepID=UPI0025D42EA7|nr:hypothetical protein [Phenylobacterium sp.]MBT9471772.1 hypothetical protein [Phenylobacterium sp.]
MSVDLLRVGVISLLLTLAACDEPAPWARAAVQPALTQVPGAPRPQSIAWNEAKGAFEIAGVPLKAGRLWTFDGSTEGFVVTGGAALPGAPVGLEISNDGADPVLRSPMGLALDGGRYSLVLVRMTRTRAGAAWDGAIFYRTAAHGESGDFQARPIDGDDPAVNETVVVVYDMARLKKGGDDWKMSLIDQIRLDTDNQPGGGFVVHQIAVTENPGPEALTTAALTSAAIAAR